MSTAPRPVALPAATDPVYRRYRDRGALGFAEIEPAVREILQTVREQGDAALIDYTKRFDKVDLSGVGIEVGTDEWEDAVSHADSDLMATLMRAAHNIRVVHDAQRVAGATDHSANCEPEAGVFAWQTFRPYASVGCYCPGGRASYPSSVLMMGVPAHVAGVKHSILCVPPRPDGTIDPVVLVAAEVADIDRVFKVGGAQAIAAMAYGTKTIPSVKKIIGPGNRYVSAAKQLCAADTELRIDSPAGPSEVAIYADDTGHADWIAADLLAQCEHGDDSIAVVITTSPKLADDIAAEVTRQLATMDRRAMAERSWTDWGAIWIAESESAAMATLSDLAFEHVEFAVDEPERLLPLLRHGGSIFMGHHAPVACGDYATGTNHVLPTGGWSRVYSGLNVRDYGTTMFVQQLTPGGLEGLAPTVQKLAKAEGLTAHAASIAIRLRGKS